MKTDFDWKNPSWTNLFITLPWGIGVLAAFLGWNADHTIAKREHTTIGVITEHRAGRADRYSYTFSINGDNFEGSSVSIDRHNVGDKVTLFYDPVDPHKSALRDYKDLTVDDFALLPFALAGMVAVAWYIGYARRRNTPISP